MNEPTIKTMTELELQAMPAPKPASTAELSAFIDQLLEREHDYGTCVYAMSLAATAAYELVAHKLGVTGFQASYASFDIIRRTCRIEGPFMLLKLEHALYPQYDLVGDVKEWLVKDSSREWLKKQAIAKLSDSSMLAHPDVKAHWEDLAANWKVSS